MSYSASEKKKLTLGEAQERRVAFQNNSSTLNDFNSAFFGKDAIEDVLAQTGCVGIRVVMTYDSTIQTNQKTLVVVGVDSSGNELTSGGEIYLSEKPCPPACHGTTKPIETPPEEA